ncbi:MAG: polyprenyl diphosphate synthase [bacterium]|nr:polyprenyl diphosphate synthase [bacterium]
MTLFNNTEQRIPKHIVLFPDGNRRWAKERGIDTMEGHRAGYDNLVDFCEWCKKKGVSIVTAFGFSTENWNRTEHEVSYLMRLLEEGLLRNLQKFQDLKVHVRVIGQKERLPKSLQQAIEKVEGETKGNSEFFLNLAISYGGRWDIMQASQRMIKEGVKPEEVTEEKFASYLSMAGLQDPDLVIRAGGEKRLSNFVLWQAAYAELYFCPKYWPEFTEKDLEEAIEDFASRTRRFGH